VANTGTSLISALESGAPLSILSQYVNSIGKLSEDQQAALVPYVFSFNEYDIAANMSATSRAAIGRLFLTT